MSDQHEIDPGDSERERLLHQVRHQQKRIAELESSIAGLDVAIDRLKAERNDARKERDDALAKHEVFVAQVEKATARIEQKVDGAKDNAETRIWLLERQLAEARRDVDALGLDYKNLLAESNAYELERDALRAENEKLRKWAEIGRALGEARERAGTMFTDLRQARADIESCAWRARALLLKERAALAPEAPKGGES